MSYTIRIINNKNNEITDLHWTDAEVLALKNTKIGDAGIIDYIKNAIDGIVHKCIKNMRREWEAKVKDEYETLPTSDESFIRLITSRSDYKDAELRDIQEKDRMITF